MAAIIPYATILTLDYSLGVNYSVSYNIEIQIEDNTGTSPVYEYQSASGKFQIPNDLVDTDGLFETTLQLSTSTDSGLQRRNIVFRKNVANTVDIILKYDKIVNDINNYKQYYICDFVVNKTAKGFTKDMFIDH